MNSQDIADVIVIGLGAFGSATAYQLARRGAKVIGIDRFSPPHTHGSSHGATRITRLAVGEGEVYVPLVKRSHAIWAELEALAPQRSLYLRTGGLIMGPPGNGGHHHGSGGFVQRTVDTARRFGIAHETLQGHAITERFPQFTVQGDELGYYEPDAGVLRPEACVDAQITEARRLGANIRLDERVLSIDSSPSGARVRTDHGNYAARQVIVTAGAWVPGLAGGVYASRLKIMRQVLYWFKPVEPALYRSPGCPIFIWLHGDRDEDEIYGFPMVDEHGGVKVATEQYSATTDPDRVDRSITEVQRREMFDAHVAGRLRGVTPECVHAVSCLYTVSTDAGFIVDRHPELDNVTVVSACSGHGFKHSAGMGEQLALRALGEPTVADWGAFALSRFDAQA